MGVKAKVWPEGWTEEPTRIACRHSAQPVLFVHVTGRYEQLAMRIESAVNSLARRLKEQAAPPAGVPFLAFHAVDETSFELDIGVLVEEWVRGRGELKLGSLPAGRYLTFAEQANDAALASCCGDIEAWLTHHQEHATGPVYASIWDGGPHEAGGVPVLVVQQRIQGGPANLKTATAHRLLAQYRVWKRLAGLVQELSSAAAALQDITRSPLVHRAT